VAFELAMPKKSALVQLHSFNRVVDFCLEPAALVGTDQVTEQEVSAVRTEREALLESIRRVFQEKINPYDKLTLQVKSEEWGGVFVDFFNDAVPDKSVFKVILERCDEVCSPICYINKLIAK